MSTPDRRQLLLLWGPVVVYMMLIFYLSSLPMPPLPPGINDKSGHSIGYFGFAVVVVRALVAGLPSRVRLGHALFAMLICIGYGISDELHQHFVPGRTADIHDVYADATGAAAGVVACWAWGIISRRPDV